MSNGFIAKETKDCSRRLRGFFGGRSTEVDSTVLVSEALSAFETYKPFATKFDESIDLDVRLGIDPKKPDQIVKTAVVLPHGNGKKPKLLALADGDMGREAIRLGAVLAGVDDMIDGIVNGSIVPGKDFDSCVATTEAMVKLAKSPATKIIGKAGLLPNAKVGTVLKDIIPVVKEVLGGRIAIKADKSGFVRLSLGRLKTFSSNQIRENLFAVILAIKAAKPSSLKGSLFLAVRLSSTMSPFSAKIKLSDIYEGTN